MDFANSQFKNLAKAPSEMIDNGEGKPTLRFLVQKILKLVTVNAGQLTIPEICDKMDLGSIYVVFPCGLLPLPAVVGNLDFIQEFAKVPTSVRLAFGGFLSDNPIHCFPGLGLGHVLHQAQDPALAPAIVAF